MGYVMMVGSCLNCNKVFSFNPKKVPSMNNEPVCQQCMDALIDKELKAGMTPKRYASDAYEAIPEEEL